LIFQTEKQLEEYGDKVPEDKKGTITDALNELKEAHKMQDMAKVEAATATLTEAWTAASQDMYADTQAGGAEGPTADSGAGADTGASDDAKEDVTDVEFEEVDEK